MPVHPVASAGFSAHPERYETGRPGYPTEAVEWLAELIGIKPTATVLDVGAGTGKLTRHLVATGASVIAVEPVRAMSDVLRRVVPSVRVVQAPAEQLPFIDSSIDCITVGQAFHWFDAPAAWTEFARVLRPGGGVGLIWNVRDRSEPWVDTVWSVMDRVEKKAPWRNHEDPVVRTMRSSHAAFQPMESEQFHHRVPSTRDMMMDRFASVSHVAVLPEANRREVLDEVWRALPIDEPFDVPYRVDVYATRRS